MFDDWACLLGSSIKETMPRSMHGANTFLESFVLPLSIIGKNETCTSCSMWCSNHSEITSPSFLNEAMASSKVDCAHGA